MMCYLKVCLIPQLIYFKDIFDLFEDNIKKLKKKIF